MEADWVRPVVHWEIQAKDPAKIREFYMQMFNWPIGEGNVMQIGAGIGAPEPITGHILPSERSGVVLYIQVLDLRATLARAEALGGAIIRQPFDLPNGPTLGGITDPEGNQVVLVQQ